MFVFFLKIVFLFQRKEKKEKKDSFFYELKHYNKVPIACEVLGVELPQTHVIDTLKARVFRELWQRGFWLAKGTSFGCDYLV